MLQKPLTIIASVASSRRGQLEALLERIQQPDVESNSLVSFSNIKSIHFARFVLLDDLETNFPLQLVFSSDYDGEENAHMKELIREAGEGLCQIYSCCSGFSGDLMAFWKAHQVPTHAFYNGHPGLAAQHIQYEESLRTIIVDYLANANAAGELQSLTAIRIKETVTLFLKRNNHLKAVGSLASKTPLQKLVFDRKALFLFLAGVAVTTGAVIYLFNRICRGFHLNPGLAACGSILLLGSVLLYYKKKLNRLEATDMADYTVSASQVVRKLMHAENFQVQNQLTHLVQIKPGSLRLKLLSTVLWAIHFLARTYFNKGSLGSIPSIHFARWIIIDKGKRLLFFSNFDGSWENYLGDFVDKAATGLTAVWSNTINFPRSHNLVEQGARDERHFKEWARQLQRPTQVWYSAYKSLSVQNINNNMLIHYGLYRTMNEEKAQAWLDRLFLSIN